MLLLHTLTTAALTGLIWTIQLVHYPSFHFVNEEDFSDFHKHHSTSISFIVIPLMFAELISIIYINVVHNSLHDRVLLILTVLIWISTFAIQVPCHHQLAHAKDASTIKRLVRSNWIRTLCWSLKLGLIALV